MGRCDVLLCVLLRWAPSMVSFRVILYFYKIVYAEEF